MPPDLLYFLRIGHFRDTFPFIYITRFLLALHVKILTGYLARLSVLLCKGCHKKQTNKQKPNLQPPTRTYYIAQETLLKII